MVSVETFTGIINQVLPEPHAGLLSGILFGTKATLSTNFKSELITTGTLHIVALSGMNISILLILLNVVLTRYFKRPIANMVSIVTIIGFISLVGISPSVVRAALMAGISLLAVSVGKQSWPLWSWMLAVIIMLLLNPLWIGDVSFQLSVLAALGLILFGPKQRSIDGVGNRPEHENDYLDRQNSLKQGLSANILTGVRYGISNLSSLIADDLRVTLAAQVFTFPVLLFQFHQISLISPVSNVLIGWIIAPVMTTGILLIIAGLIWLPIAQILGWIVWVLLSYVMWVIHITAAVPYAGIRW